LHARLGPPVGDPKRTVASAELNAITCGEPAHRHAENLDSGKPFRRVLEVPTIVAHHRKSVGIEVHAFDLGVSSLLD